MKNAIVRLGFCLLFFCMSYTAFAGVPSVTVTAVARTKNTPIVFTVTFSEDVTGFTLSDVTITGPAAAGAGTATFATTNPSTYTVTVPGLTTNGDLILTVPAAVCKSVSTNDDNTAGNFTSNFDTAKPNITDIDKKSGQPDPTVVSPVVFVVKFSEPINTTTFTNSDIKFTGSTAGLIASLSVNATTGITAVGANDDTFEVTVDINSSAPNGNIKISINAGDVEDKATNTNNASGTGYTDDTIVFNGFLPTIAAAATVTAIDEDEATLGGNVTAQGSTTVSRGVYYKTGSGGVTTSDTQNSNGTGTGVFTEAISGLTPATHYYFKAYATNTGGTVLSNEKSFWTLATNPTSAVTPTLAMGATSAHLEFPKANTLGSKGYVILRRLGQAPEITDLPDGVAPDSLASLNLPAPANNTTVVAMLGDNVDFYDDNTLSACSSQDYYYAVVIYNQGSNRATTNYRRGSASSFITVNGKTGCSTSDVIVVGGSQQLGYYGKTGNTIASASDGLSVFSLRLRDVSADSKATELTSIKITIDHPEYLKKIAYIDGTYVDATQAPAATMTFTIPAGKTVTNDNTTHDFGFYATFEAGNIATDQLPIEFKVIEVKAKAGGSGLASETPSGVDVTHNINVIATKFVIVGPSGSVAPNADFSFTITALDANDKIDTNPAHKVTLSQTAGNGTMIANDSGGLTQTLSGGTFTWTQLQFSTATTTGGTKTIKAVHSAGTPSIPDAFLTGIVVKSNGVKITFNTITPGPATSPQILCFGDSTSTSASTFSNLNDIVIEESDGSDFGAGTDQTLSLLLPPGFIFHTGTNPTVTTNSATSGTNIAAAGQPWAGFVYFPQKNVVRIKYTVNATGGAAKDKLTITGLKIKYIGTTAVSNKKIVRIGGTAAQEGNSDTDGRSHGDLGAGSGMEVSFIVTAGATNDTQTAFSKDSDPITLQGIKTAGSVYLTGPTAVFSGDGVAFDGTDYKFYPRNVSLGPHTVNFTYTDGSSNPPGCVSSFTQTLTTFSTIITGLKTAYCIDDIGNAIGVPTSPPPYTTCNINIVGLGIFTFEKFQAPNDYKYMYRDKESAYAWLELPSQTNFDPRASQFSAEAAEGVITVGIFYRSFCTANLEDAGVIINVRINKKPVLNFDPIVKANEIDGLCATGGLVKLTAFPYTSSNNYDEFWVSPVGNSSSHITGVEGDRTAGFSFNPKTANTTGADKIVQINYQHKDENGCTNETYVRVPVWKKPDLLTAAAMSFVPISGGTVVDGIVNAAYCFADPVNGEFSIKTPNAAEEYKFYSVLPSTRGSQVNTKYGVQSNDFLLIGNNPKVGETATYGVTRTQHKVAARDIQVDYYYPDFFGNPYNSPITVFGKEFPGCESDQLALSATIKEPTVVKLDKATAICKGNDLDLAAIHPELTSPDTNLPATWKTSGTGTFLPSDVYGVATLYHPSDADIDNGKFVITLESADPSGPCQEASAESVITVNPGTKVSFPVSPIIACANGDATVATSVSDKATFTWSVKAGENGSMLASTIHESKALFVPTASQLDGGDEVTLIVSSDDPDGAGPCLADIQEVELVLQRRPRVYAGADYNICTDAAHDLSVDMKIDLHADLTTLGLSSAQTWTWSIKDNPSASWGTIDDVNSLITKYNPSKGAGDITKDNPGRVTASFIRPITFTITAPAPSGNVCPTETDDVIVTIIGTPVTPTPDVLTKYCVGESIRNLKTELPSPHWYTTKTYGSSFSDQPEVSSGVVNTAEAVKDMWLTTTLNTGCESDFGPLTIVVNPLPNPGFKFSNKCFGDIMQFTDSSSVATPIPANIYATGRKVQTWQWSFADGAKTEEGEAGVVIPENTATNTVGTYDAPGHTYPAVNDYEVRLVVKSSDGCSNFFTKIVQVGNVPDAGFVATKLCDADQTLFTSSSALPTSVANASKFTWTFGDVSNNTSTNHNPTHKFTGVGTYEVELKIVTKLGCKDSIKTLTSIYPYIKDFPYIETFEGGHGWVPEGKVYTSISDFTNETSWNLLTAVDALPTDPDPAAGAKFWATHTNTGDPKAFYYDNERSVLNGPCVDMTNLTRPVIALDYFNHTEPRSDGSYIEYRIEDEDGDGTWERLGDTGQGLDWYNENSIGGLSFLGDVGQTLSQFGWSDSTKANGWRTGRYNLDDLAGETRLRFRVVFGSNVSPVKNVAYNGFAFDNFKLESRNRLVLVESFTSNGASGAAGNRDIFQAFPSVASSSEVVKIEYHTGIAGQTQDAIFKQNTMDPNARASFYGINAVPRAYIDGFSDASAGGMFTGAWASDYYNTESLRTSPIDIEVNPPTILDGQLTVSGSVKARDTDILGNRYTLYIAIVEKTVGDDMYVLRKMLPSASGIKIDPMAKGVSMNFEQSWNVEESALSQDPDDDRKLIAIAFVQSDIPNAKGERIILQAAFNDQTPVLDYTTGLEIPFLEQTALYPNPADKIVHIDLPEATKFGAEVSIIDQLGRPVINSTIGIGQKSTSVNTIDLSGAVYIVQLRENGVLTTRRLLVTHSHR